MPQLSPIWFRNGRRPAIPPFKFKEMAPLKLKDNVSGKGNRDKVAPCVSEVLTLLSCFENGGYNELFCTKEIEAYRQCYVAHLAKVELKKKQGVEGTLIPNQRLEEMSHKQVNKLLKQFPIPK